MTRIICSDCGAAQDELSTALQCAACSGPLEVALDLQATEAGLAACLRHDLSGLWRYAGLLPFSPDFAPISMGEGGTPVVEMGRWARGHGFSRAYAKLEHLSPTGSFKDRGAAVLITHLVQLGVATAVEDSSGNAGAAIAAYCAHSGIRAVVFAPASAPPAKLAQIEMYGAQLQRVAGTRADVAHAAAEAATLPYTSYASHNLHPYFIEGTKTFAYEIYEKFGESVPEHIVFPVGNGSLFLGAAKGFAELQRIGCRFALPRLHVAQSEACPPIVAAAQAGNHQPVDVVARPTIAGGISIAKPVRGRQVLRTLAAGGGSAVAVTEREAWEVRLELARSEGLFMEPTAAVAFAAAVRLRRSGVIGENEAVVIPVTGAGLKDPQPAEPPP